jgi:hypothetical protein
MQNSNKSAVPLLDLNALVYVIGENYENSRR